MKNAFLGIASKYAANIAFFFEKRTPKKAKNSEIEHLF